MWSFIFPHINVFTSPYVFCPCLNFMRSKCEISFKCELFVWPRQLRGMEEEEYVKVNMSLYTLWMHGEEWNCSCTGYLPQHLGGGELLASHHDCFTSGNKALTAHWIGGGWVPDQVWMLGRDKSCVSAGNKQCFLAYLAHSMVTVLRSWWFVVGEFVWRHAENHRW